MEKGLVIKSTGSWYKIRSETNEILDCRISGKFRLQGIVLTNPVAVGDLVWFLREDKNKLKGTIKKVENRRNYVVRQSPRKKHQLHLIASNIDQAIIITTIVEPMVKLGFIDRFLLMTEPHNIPVTIVFNKIDLYSEEDFIMLENARAIYDKIGYQTIAVSAMSNENLDAFKDILKDKTTLIGGQSGVGKSSLVNAIAPNLELHTFEISDHSGKGQHTTTFAEMYDLEFGGNIIDTPGIKTLSFTNLEPLEITHNFREFFKLSDNCKYSNCAHRDEPNCAVKTALENGDISIIRYQNYLSILEEVEDQNSWERHKKGI